MHVALLPTINDVVGIGLMSISLRFGVDWHPYKLISTTCTEPEPAMPHCTCTDVPVSDVTKAPPLTLQTKVDVESPVAWNVCMAFSHALSRPDIAVLRGKGWMTTVNSRTCPEQPPGVVSTTVIVA